MNDARKRDATEPVDVQESAGDAPAADAGHDDAGPQGAGHEGAETLDLDDVDALRARVVEVEERAEDLQDRLLRKQAELVNYRRRVDRERQELGDVARSELLRELLPLIDDFERAVAADAGDADAYREGVELILRGVKSLMRRLGVERLDPAGEPFDPTFHEAVARRAADDVPAGHVAEVFQPGYTLGERLLRPAMVVVSAGAGDAGEAAPAADAADDAGAD